MPALLANEGVNRSAWIGVGLLAASLPTFWYAGRFARGEIAALKPRLKVIREVPVSESVSIFDIVNGQFIGTEDQLTFEFRNYLRRHGIRFKPFAWDTDFKKGL